METSDFMLVFIFYQFLICVLARLRFCLSTDYLTFMSRKLAVTDDIEAGYGITGIKGLVNDIIGWLQWVHLIKVDRHKDITFNF